MKHMNLRGGRTGSIKSNGSTEKDLVDFQAALIAAHDMQQRGLLHITKIHKESSTSKRLIDLIIFVRLR